MSEPWMNLVVWPECSDCRSTGVAKEDSTGWPVECSTCITRRRRAVTKAQTDLRKVRTK